MSALEYRDIRFTKKNALILIRYHVIPRGLMNIVNGNVMLPQISHGIAAKLIKLIPFEVKMNDQWVLVTNIEKLNQVYMKEQPIVNNDSKPIESNNNKQLLVSDSLLLKEDVTIEKSSNVIEESFTVVSDDDIIEKTNEDNNDENQDNKTIEHRPLHIKSKKNK